jgi:hypothetical protein
MQLHREDCQGCYTKGMAREEELAQLKRELTAAKLTELGFAR